jgi:hypothetical protein
MDSPCFDVEEILCSFCRSVDAVVQEAVDLKNEAGRWERV